MSQKAVWRWKLERERSLSYAKSRTISSGKQDTDDEDSDGDLRQKEEEKLEELLAKISKAEQGLEDVLVAIEGAILEDKSTNSLDKKAVSLRKLIGVFMERADLIKKKLGKKKNKDSLEGHNKDARIVVPANLPKFRQGGQHEDPIEFLDSFINLMEAHEINMERYSKLLSLCLDSVDNQWLDTVKSEKWQAVRANFIAHFSHSNQNILYRDQICKLKMTNTGVQRYTDQFIRLALRIGWKMDNEEAIYQYKEGLQDWMHNNLVIAIAARSGEKPLDVEQLGRMALEIESNRKKPRYPEEKPKYKPKPYCKICERVGHTDKDCRYRKKEDTAVPPAIPEKKEERYNLNLDGFKYRVKDDRNRGEPRPPMKCYNCGKIGHRREDCTEKRVNTVSVGENKRESSNYESVNSIEFPCLVNNRKVIAVLDTGANVSLIDLNLVEEMQLVIEPRQGVIQLAVKGGKESQIGVTRVNLKAGDESVDVNLEVAKLGSEVKLLIGMDLFEKLRFKLNNVPILFPRERKEETIIKLREKVEVGLPKGVDENGIHHSWKKVIEDNLALPINSVCKLEGSTLSINTGDNKPSWIRQYPIAEAFMDKVRARIVEWKESGKIVPAPSNCSWNSPLIAIRKVAAEKGKPDDIRLCLDARFINERTIEMPDSNMPLLRDVIDRLGKFNWISVIDLADSYNQFRLREEDQVKTAFTIDGKQWMFTVVPFGLKIMTGHMQRIMEKLLGNIGIVPFQDDTATASVNAEEHIKMVKTILEKITYEAGLRVRLSKCKFFKTEAKVLGMMVSREGIRMDPKKIESIASWPQPKDGKGMQRFMGAANFHREFSHEFAKLAAPLDECRNMKLIEWTPVRVKAFDQIKEFFKKNIELQHIDWKKKMYLTTDASQVGVGAWIGQLNDKGDLLPVICRSKKMSETQQRWAATKRELYALMWAMKKFRYYLLGRHFVVRVDHKPLVSLLRNKMTMLTEGWIETIMEYSFSTEYLPGEENVFADVLSRSYEGIVQAINVQVETDEEWKAELRGLQLPAEGERRSMVEKCHAMGHFGVTKMMDKIRENGYWWPKMKSYIEKEINSCQTCLRFNIEKEGYHPAKSIVAKEPWDHIEIDLIGPVNTSEEGYSYILTIVDVCTDYTIVRALKNKAMETVARKLWKVMSEFGNPRVIQSDNGLEFVNSLIKSLTTMYGIDHRLTTAYHPSANGLVERKNKEVSRALKKYTDGTYAAWNEWLPLVQMSLNKAISQKTKSTAFALMFGRKFNNFKDFREVELVKDKNKGVDELKEHWNEFHQIVLPGLDKRVNEVKQKQESRLNSRKQLENFKPGDKVMVLDVNRGSKWDPVYEGPYEVVEQHRGGAYSLKNELGDIMEPRRTINMLKPVKEKLEKTEEDYEVEKVIDHIREGRSYKYLVKWKGYEEKDNTWVLEKDFNQKELIKKYWRQKQIENSSRLSTKGLGGSHVRNPSKKPQKKPKSEARKKQDQVKGIQKVSNTTD